MRYYYGTQHLKLDEKISLCRKAKEVCDSWFVDVLKASCLRRERVDLNFDDIIKILEKSRLTHFTAIYRDHEQRLEISFSTLGNNDDHFLWIYLYPEKAEELLVGLKKVDQ